MKLFQFMRCLGLPGALGIYLSSSSSVLLGAPLLEEVVVTAQKREQSLQDVGISITAFSGDQISELGYTNTTDIAAQTPSLSFSQVHPISTQVTIRGVSQSESTSIHLEPPVAMYMDEAYISAISAAHMQMYDIERVEVLRGPQGTLFGRNATGGLMHFVSRKPGDEFEAYGTLTVAEYEQRKFEGAIGGPINDLHSARLALALNRNDGYISNRIGPDLRDNETYAARLHWLYEVSPDLSALFRINYSSDDSTGGGFTHTPSVGDPTNHGLGRKVGSDELAQFSDFLGGTFSTCPGCDAFGYKEPDDDVYTGAFDEVGIFDREIVGANLKVTWAGERFTLTSISDHLAMDSKYLEDTDGSPFTQLNASAMQDFEQFSQEIRLVGETQQTRWITGLYYLDIDADSQVGVKPEDVSPFLGAPQGAVLLESENSSIITTKSWAVFAHTEYDISPSWTLIGALRYTEDTREMDYTLQDNLGTFQQFNPRLNPDAEQEFENISLKAEVDWKPIENWLLYASYNRGHKAGNFSAPFLGPVNLSTLPHDEEILTSYELGFKSTLFNGRARINANVSHYDYDDYQASFFLDFAQTVRNLDATVNAAEVEVALTLTDRLEIQFGGAWLDSNANRVGLPDGTFVDRDLPLAADYSLNGLARYTWPLMDGAVTFQADFNYTDDFCFTLVCHTTEQEDGYAVGNIRIGYTPQDDHWHIAVFVRNIGDEEYRVAAVDGSFVGLTTSAYAPPQWVGGEIGFAW